MLLVFRIVGTDLLRIDSFVSARVAGQSLMLSACSQQQKSHALILAIVVTCIAPQRALLFFSWVRASD
jgi:hypothetical protein